MKFNQEEVDREIKRFLKDFDDNIYPKTKPICRRNKPKILRRVKK